MCQMRKGEARNWREKCHMILEQPLHWSLKLKGSSSKSDLHKIVKTILQKNIFVDWKHKI